MAFIAGPQFTRPLSRSKQRYIRGPERARKSDMKTRICLLVLAVGVVLATAGCSTSASVGTPNHHVGVSGSVG
jgi:hypothetical protein